MNIDELWPETTARPPLKSRTSICQTWGVSADGCNSQAIASSITSVNEVNEVNGSKTVMCKAMRDVTDATSKFFSLVGWVEFKGEGQWKGVRVLETAGEKGCETGWFRMLQFSIQYSLYNSLTMMYRVFLVSFYLALGCI